MQLTKEQQAFINHNKEIALDNEFHYWKTVYTKEEFEKMSPEIKAKALENGVSEEIARKEITAYRKECMEQRKILREKLLSGYIPSLNKTTQMYE